MDDNRPTPALYQCVFWIGIIAFAAMAVGGLFHSLHDYGSLPAIALSYKNSIDDRLRSRQFDEAAEQMRLALLIESGGSFSGARLEVYLGDELITHNAVPKAIRHFRRALEIDPNFAQAHYALGAVIAQQGDPRTAEDHYRKAIELDKDYAAPYYGLGKLYEANRQPAKSIEYFEKALTLFALASRNAKTSRTEEQHIYEIEPDAGSFARVHNRLALDKFSRGDAQAALDHIEKALELDERYAEAHNNAAGIYFKMGEPRKALTHLEAALRIKPEFREARINYEATLRMLQQGPQKSQSP